MEVKRVIQDDAGFTRGGRRVTYRGPQAQGRRLGTQTIFSKISEELSFYTLPIVVGMSASKYRYDLSRRIVQLPGINNMNINLVAATLYWLSYTGNEIRQINEQLIEPIYRRNLITAKNTDENTRTLIKARIQATIVRYAVHIIKYREDTERDFPRTLEEQGLKVPEEEK